MRFAALIPVTLAAGLFGAHPALASAAGGTPQPQTWLNWIMSVEVGGRPLFHSEAVLAFAWSLVAMVTLLVISVLGTRRLSIRPRGIQTVLEMVVTALRGLVTGIMGPRGADFVPF
ncbi:MAG TPA: hypothetical protein VMY87_05090, partial [Armatimonadota bacterium]|nr:hypothetical protein [Armatimonadota bacterium]